MEMRKIINKNYFLFRMKLFVKSIIYSRNLNKRIYGGKVSSYVLGGVIL